MSDSGSKDSGQFWVTKDKVENMIRAEFDNYERTIGLPRHMENFGILKQIRGGITALKVLGGIALSLAGLYLAYLKTKP